LYDECDFETCFDDFLAIVKEPEEYGMPGQSFNSLDLYVANDEKEKVIQEFTDFLQHLKTLKPLRGRRDCLDSGINDLPLIPGTIVEVGKKSVNYKLILKDAFILSRRLRGHLFI
jgi:hypothetical protein